MTALQSITTHPIEPRGLRREAAAFYVGIGTTKFDEMVADGRMPQPRRIDGARVWDRRELDAAFDNLPSRGCENQAGRNPFDSLLP